KFQHRWGALLLNKSSQKSSLKAPVSADLKVAVCGRGHVQSFSPLAHLRKKKNLEIEKLR
ncbi:MAG: hypothetical protein KJ773_06465, partial [Candidatus Thermoplasmatota archaeon]|nr:hypothetical protein [Candidatus Thermoplasmatota archaeon]